MPRPVALAQTLSPPTPLTNQAYGQGVRAMRANSLRGLFPSSIEPVDVIATAPQDSDVSDGG